MIAHPKSDRVILGEAVRKSLFPVLRDLGFEQKGKSYLFQRCRNNERDSVEFWWGKYNRAKFVIQFTTTEMERLDALRRRAPTSQFLDHVRVYPGTASIGRRLLGAEPRWFRLPRFARLTNLTKATADLMRTGEQRLREIDKYLKTGQRSRYMRL